MSNLYKIIDNIIYLYIKKLNYNSRNLKNGKIQILRKMKK